jgi:hypothetical protein
MSQIEALVRNKKFKREHVKLWQYPETPALLPRDIYDYVYKNDKPHAAGYECKITPVTTKGALRKSGTAIQRKNTGMMGGTMTGMNMGNMMMHGGMNMGNMMSGSSSSSGDGMPSMNTMQAFMQQMAFMAFQQVAQQQQQQQSQADKPESNIKLFTPAPRVRQQRALPEVPGHDSQSSEDSVRLPAGAALEQPMQDAQVAPTNDTGISAQEAARIIQHAMDKAANTTGVMKRPAKKDGHATTGAKAKAEPKSTATKKATSKAAPKATAKTPVKTAMKNSRMPKTMAKRLELRPRGCSKCRFKKPGCHPSCW